MFDLASFEVEKKPAVTEVEVSVVAMLMHVFEQLGIKNLKHTESLDTTWHWIHILGWMQRFRYDTSYGGCFIDNLFRRNGLKS